MTARTGAIATFESIFKRSLDMVAARDQRERVVLKNGSVAILAVSVGSLPISIVIGQPSVGVLVTLLGSYSAIGLWLVATGRLNSAKHTLICGLIAQLTIECFVFSGSGTKLLGSVHFLFVPLVIVLHFVRLDPRGHWITEYSLLCAAIFFIIEFSPLLDGPRPIPFTEHQTEYARVYVFCAMWLALLSLMHLIMRHINEAESNLRLLNGRVVS